MRRRNRSACPVIEFIWFAIFMFGVLIAGMR